MNKISLKNLLPDIFKEEPPVSDIWQNNIDFVTGKTYLIESVSGKGKSSLCSYIYGYRRDYSGNILLDENNIKSLDEKAMNKIRRVNISLLFQELRLFPELTVMENILIKNNLTGFKKFDDIEAMLKHLKIEDKINTPISKMSWGQQQRVAVVRALCQPYNFIILDEPVSHLDDENSRLIAELVSDEAYTQGAGVIITSIGKHLPLRYDQRFAL